MPLALKLANLEDTHESLHDLYEEKDGAFHLVPPEGFTATADLEDTSGLKSALTKTRDEKRDGKSVV